LPDELDPQVKEFAGQLRRLVDRSGLSIAAVADRTGYSKTSWERYLNGRLLAPKGAIVALAEVTGTNPVHLTTMWELAERAWSRSEMRHDMTMEAIRISQARAALGETGGQPVVGKGGAGRGGRNATATPGVAGPAGVSPTVPPSIPSQGSGPDQERSYGGSPAPYGGSPASYGGRGGSTPGGAEAARGSWGVTPSPSDPSGPSQGAVPRGSSRPGGPDATGGPGGPGAFGPAGTPQDARPGGGAPQGAPRKRRLPMLLAGVVGAAVVVGLAFFFANGDGEKTAEDKPTAPSTSAAANPDLPPGVKCVGDSCKGKDAEAMGCSADVTTASTATVGTTVVEVRYSEVCSAAWGRITQAAQGDEVEVTAGKTKQTGAVETAGDAIAYTPMVAVKDADDAKACVTLKAGQEGCTQ
jgi:hypothetical protein